LTRLISIPYDSAISADNFPNPSTDQAAQTAASVNAPPTSDKSVRSNALDMPEAAMYGRLGQYAQSMQAPFAWGYTSLLTVFAGLGVDAGAQVSSVRPTLYTCLLGIPGSGKSVSIKRAKALLQPDSANYCTTTPGSDRGLVNLLNSTLAKSASPSASNAVCLSQDEYKDTFSKINIQGSSLAPLLCKLYYEDEGGSADKHGVHETSVRLSMLGGLAIRDLTEFQAIFGSGTTAGLYDRFIFAPGPKDWAWDPFWAVPATTPILPVAVELGREQYEAINRWADSCRALGQDPGRLKEIALRVAVISSSANGDSKVTDAAVAAAIEFARWQAKVRETYGPGVALNQDAQVSSAILDGLLALSKKTGKVALVKWRDFVSSKNLNRKFGSPMVTRNRDSLVQGGQLICEVGEDKRPTGYYRLAVATVAEEQEGTC
jgi:hypothetical protein